MTTPDLKEQLFQMLLETNAMTLNVFSNSLEPKYVNGIDEKQAVEHLVNNLADLITTREKEAKREVLQGVWNKGLHWREGFPCPDVSKLPAGDYWIISKKDLNALAELNDGEVK
jgi:hypothetical protein